MRIVFFGTPQIASRVLRALHGLVEVSLVITQQDKPVGRRQEITESDVSATARELNLNVLKPASLKNQGLVDALAKVEADFFVVVAYGKIIPQEILDIPKKGAVNLHGSILPKYRGASPIHAALLNGDTKTGITIMLMDAKMDHGPVLAVHETAINSDETFEQLSDKIAGLAEEYIVQDIQKFARGEIQPKLQDESEATYTKILEKSNGLIDWEQDASQIYNQYRALHLWPGIWTRWNGKVLKIVKCSPSQNSLGEPGLVFNEGEDIFVAAGKGSLQIFDIQIEGKNSTSISDFARGHKNFIGAILT